MQADIHECEIGTFAGCRFHGFCRVARYCQHPVARPFDEIAEVPRNEDLVFDDQYGCRHDTADWSGKVTCTAYFPAARSMPTVPFNCRASIRISCVPRPVTSDDDC